MMTIRKKILQTAGAGALIALFASGAQAALINAGFETGTGGPCAAGWTCFEGVFTQKTDVDPFGPTSHDTPGTNSLKMFGPFNGAPSSGAYQSDTASAGVTYTASAWVMNWEPDAFNNRGTLKLSFWDAPGGQSGGGNNIGEANVNVAVSGNPGGEAGDILLAPQDGFEVSDWTNITATLTAPAGTQSLEVFLLHNYIGNGGSLFWDDISVTAVPVPAAVWLFGSGLLGLVGVARRRKAQA